MIYAVKVMISSQSSKISLDPFSDVLNTLEIRSIRRTRLEASGAWSLRFAASASLKFVAILRGRCWVTIPGQPATRLSAGDTYLLCDTEHVITSNPALSPIDGMPLFEGPDNDVARLNGNDTVALGGGIVLAPGGARFLLDTLPAFMLMRASSPAAGAIGKMLGLLENEIGRARLGESLVTSRLADILLIEALRAYAEEQGTASLGWVGALSDRQIGDAIRLMHSEIAHPWKVGELATAVGMSRSAFAQRFATLVGKPPLGYLRSWRMILALHALQHEKCTIGTLASRLGYASESAFGHAYKQTFGQSPRSARSR